MFRLLLMHTGVPGCLAALGLQCGAMNWLVKEEPTHYGFDALVKDKKAVWSGVRNALAQKHLRAIRKGDRIFYYHTGDEKAVVAEIKADAAFKDFPLVRIARLSVMPVTDAEWARIEGMAGKTG